MIEKKENTNPLKKPSDFLLCVYTLRIGREGEETTKEIDAHSFVPADYWDLGYVDPYAYIWEYYSRVNEALSRDYVEGLIDIELAGKPLEPLKDSLKVFKIEEW